MSRLERSAIGSPFFHFILNFVVPVTGLKILPEKFLQEPSDWHVPKLETNAIEVDLEGRTNEAKSNDFGRHRSYCDWNFRIFVRKVYRRFGSLCSGHGASGLSKTSANNAGISLRAGVEEL